MKNRFKKIILFLMLMLLNCQTAFATNYFDYRYDILCTKDNYQRVLNTLKAKGDFFYLVFVNMNNSSKTNNYLGRDYMQVYLFPKYNFKMISSNNDGIAWNMKFNVNYSYKTNSISNSSINSVLSSISHNTLTMGQGDYKKMFMGNYNKQVSISDVLIGSQSTYENRSYRGLVATNCPDFNKFINKIPFLDEGGSSGSFDGGGSSGSSSHICECPKYLKPILSSLEEINKYLKNQKDKTDNEYLIKIYSVLQNSIVKSVLEISSTTKQIVDRLMDFQNRFEHLLEEVKAFHTDFKSFSNKVDERLKFISEQMTTLDHDDDHPDQYSILITTQQILSYLQEHLRDLKVEVSGNSGGSSGSSDGGGSSGSSSTIPTDNGWLSMIFNGITNTNDYLDKMLQNMGQNFTVKLIGGFQEAQKDYKKYLETIIKKLDIIIDLLKNMIGNKKDLEKSIENIQDSFKGLMNQPIFDNKDTQKAFNDTYSSFNSNKKFPTLSAEFMPGVKLKYFDLSPFTGLMHTIRDILEAILWISLFLYMIRVFIPKLKI